MTKRTRQVLSRRLSDEADSYLAALVADAPPEAAIRESSFNRDARPLLVISPFEKTLAELGRSGSLGVTECAVAASFFRVRLWTQKELLEALFAHYDHLDDELKAELPLKRIWTVAAQEEE